jgi:hypothetical protein
MAYFGKLPKLLYSTSLSEPNYKLVTNIFAKAKFVDAVFSNASLYHKYSVKDGEKPEDIAFKLYNDPEKHWVILMANQCLDPKYDWPLDGRTLEKHINAKYSSVNFALNPTDTYAVNYTVGEAVYAGNTISSSTATANVVSFNTATKILTVKFVNDVFANSANVTGATSLASHQIIGITLNNDGREWASNTTAYYQVTETISNNYDNIKTTNKYTVSALDFNHSSNTVITKDTNTSYTNSYDVNGIMVTIDTTVAPVSFYDYEVEQNENRRQIKIPRKEYVGAIVEQFNRIMRT